MNSIWSESVELPRFPVLKGDVETDVLIIGGGLAGVLCAHFLQERGVDYVLTEGRSIGAGVTKNTTAKVTAQHGLIYHKLIKSEGAELTRMYLDANQAAVEKFSKMAESIDCDFERKNSYVYDVKDSGKLEKELDALHRIGYKAKFAETKELPFDTEGAICFENQAQFNPLKFLGGVAEGLNIYENTWVRELTDELAVTNRGLIRYKRIIFATHFPIDNKHGMYFLKMYQHRSYVVAYKNAPQVQGMYVDEAKTGFSFRSYGDCLLIGGGAHKTGKKGGNWQAIRQLVKDSCPEAQEVYAWATQDCMTLDKIPYIGQYSKRMSNCYVATGFNKWGMTSSMVAAEVLADMIVGKDNPYAEVFETSRSMLKPQLFVNACSATTNLLTISKKRCPHMGCALKWNKVEHTWDCPCHGSRFDGNGAVLDNPANENEPSIRTWGK